MPAHPARHGNGGPAGLDVELVARLVRTAGLACQADGTGRADVLIRAAAAGTPRGWTSRLSVDPAGALYVGPDDDREAVAVRVIGGNERQVAALIIAQALVPGSGRPLSSDEIGTLGLAGAPGRRRP